MAEKHGILGLIIKKLMIIIFTVIGVAAIVVNAIAIAKQWYPADKWYPIVNLALGCCLLTSPFFLKKEDRGVLVKIIKILMIIIFVLIGAGYIATGAYALAKGLDVKKWVSIVHIVFGSLLLTSPYFLKKD